MPGRNSNGSHPPAITPQEKAPGTWISASRFFPGEVNARMHRMKNLSLALAALLLSVIVATAQNAPAPRIDGEGINMDAPPPPTKEPHHPADPFAPNTANPPSAGTTIGQAPKDDRFPADRGDTRPVPNALK
jgi:hypothetical protein